MPDVSTRLLINIFSVLGALFALWKGGPAERMTAGIVFANVLVGQTGSLLAPDSDDVIRLVNDGLTAMVLLGVTVRYGALWMGGVVLFFAAQFAIWAARAWVTALKLDQSFATVSGDTFRRFELTAAEMAAIDGLDQGMRVGSNPDEATF